MQNFSERLHNTCLAVSGVSAILAILIKTLRRDFLYYVYFTGITIELKLGSPETKSREKKTCTKSIVFKKGLYKLKGLIFRDIMDVLFIVDAVLFIP